MFTDALPTTVEATRSGWLSTFQSAATVVRKTKFFRTSKLIFKPQSGLLAAVTAQLLVFFRTNDAFGANGDQKDHPKREAVLTLTYVALILSIGATLSSLILTDEFSDIPIRAARSPYGPESSKTEGDPIFLGKDWEILRTFGLRKSARFVVGHCESRRLQSKGQELTGFRVIIAFTFQCLHNRVHCRLCHFTRATKDDDDNLSRRILRPASNPPIYSFPCDRSPVSRCRFGST
jgi:hypothetical protein